MQVLRCAQDDIQPLVVAPEAKDLRLILRYQLRHRVASVRFPRGEPPNVAALMLRVTRQFKRGLGERNIKLLCAIFKELTLQVCAGASPGEIRKGSVFLNQPLRRQVGRSVERCDYSVRGNRKHLSEKFTASGRQESYSGSRGSGAVGHGCERWDTSARPVKRRSQRLQCSNTDS